MWPTWGAWLGKGEERLWWLERGKKRKEIIGLLWLTGAGVKDFESGRESEGKWGGRVAKAE